MAHVLPCAIFSCNSGSHATLLHTSGNIRLLSCKLSFPQVEVSPIRRSTGGTGRQFNFFKGGISQGDIGLLRPRKVASFEWKGLGNVEIAKVGWKDKGLGRVNETELASYSGKFTKVFFPKLNFGSHFC